jgi:succinate dehydrogenase/fumarate reductase flavoprotein subunit
VNTEIVVVGGGQAGFFAAIKAKGEGAEVILIEKNAACSSTGSGDTGLINTAFQKALNIRIDRDEAVAEIMSWSGYTADQKVITAWADNSAAAFDWIHPIYTAKGLKGLIESDVKDGMHWKSYPEMHRWFNPETGKAGAPAFLPKLAEEVAPEMGIEVRYNTPGVQLIRDEASGRVTS